MNPSEDPKQNKQQVVITTSSSSSSDKKSRGRRGARQDVVRLYECTFCKREFFNAQALGGHMNIHRKDRANKKQYSSSSSSVDKNYNSGDGSKMIRWPWINNLGGDSTNTSTSDQVLDKDSQSSELDLELRLGPPPNPPHDSSTTGTRGFF